MLSLYFIIAIIEHGIDMLNLSFILQMRKESSVVQPSDAGESFEDRTSSLHAAAVGLFTLQNLRSLEILGLHGDNDFYKGMCDAASQSKVSDYLNLKEVLYDLKFLLCFSCERNVLP